MNTDDRALADLIEQALTKVAGPRTYYRTDDVVAAVSHLIAADRLEAFHAKPRPGEGQRAVVVKAMVDLCDRYKSIGSPTFGQYADVILAALQSPPPVVSGEAIAAGLRSWVTDTHDIELSGAMIRDAVDHILAQPGLKSPPVVEEGRREAVAWQRIEDAIFEGLDANISCTQNKVRDLAKLLTARVFAILALTPVEGVGEEACGRCGGDNPAWCAPSPLWNAVMRGGSIDGDAEFRDLVCIKCFIALAEDAGVARGWRLTATDVSVELEAVTPSGRVWNERTWLWEDPMMAPETLSLVNAVANAWKAVNEDFGQLFVDEDGPVRSVRDMDRAIEALLSTPVAAQGDAVREALDYALPLVAADIDKAMRRASRDVIEELEAHERTLKALAATLKNSSHEG